MDPGAALLIMLAFQQQVRAAQHAPATAIPGAGGPQLSERWSAYLKRVRDPKAIANIAGETLFDRAFRLDGCRMGSYCVPESFGNSVAKRTTRLTIEFGMGAVLGEDLRRTPSGRKGFRSRSLYALAHGPLARNRDGAWRPAYSRFTASIASSAACDRWRGRPLTASRIGQAAAWSITDSSVDALLTEFEPDLKRVLHRVSHKLGLESW